MNTSLPLDSCPTLDEKEIYKVFDELDSDNDGIVTRRDVENKINEVLAKASRSQELGSQATEKLDDGFDDRRSTLDDLLNDIFPSNQDTLDRMEFAQCARWWRVPQSSAEPIPYQQMRIPRQRRLRAYWDIHGPNIAFLVAVLGVQIGCAIWQMLIYTSNPLAIQALGPGIVVAKFCAGALYPTLTLMLLSMSRYVNTFLRKSYFLSKFINYDYAQKFHVIMAVLALLLGTTHALAHLTGDLLYSSYPAQWPALWEYTDGRLPDTYAAKLRTLPGWTGAIAIGIFWIMAVLGMPFIRKRYFEIFQLSHLLMFPFIGLMCAHGAAAIFERPQLGYWLAFPSLMIVVERTIRLVRGFRPVMARIKVLDGHALVLVCKSPSGRDWRYSAGQYVLIQVPKLSYWQWHPFTVTSCRGNELEVHIKTSGDWTKKLHDTIPVDKDIRVGVDGPFGAPAQRFYDYDYSLVVGNGIGVTPCSAILSDLEDKFTLCRDPWTESLRKRLHPRNKALLARPPSAHPSKERLGASDSWATCCGGGYHNHIPSDTSSLSGDSTLYSGTTTPFNHSSASSISSKTSLKKVRRPKQRRVDVYWTVRDTSNLSWFSDLLNRIIDRADDLSRFGTLDIKIQTCITTKWKDFSSQVFANLIDDRQNPVSPLTGLKQRSQFGRPDFTEILERHFQDLIAEISREIAHVGVREKKVGVFYCGTPIVGQLLSDLCRQLTARAKGLGLKIRYDFHTEVFD